MTLSKNSQELESAVVRFVGDSGDGIQVTGTQFTNESALAGNDLVTLPNFPAEIRAPAGTLAGVSGFQINFGNHKINTPGDAVDALVALNAAALKANLTDLRKGGILILDRDAFDQRSLEKMGYKQPPWEDPFFTANYQVFAIPISSTNKAALGETTLASREIDRCKNFFTLGVLLWLYNRPYESTIEWINSKYGKKPALAKANILALQAGLTYAEATEILATSFVVKPAKLAPGKYKTLNGTMALSYGLLAAQQKSGLPLFFAAYPITPASELLHEMAHYKQFDVTTFQAEDEIAAVCAAIGAAYAGALGITSSSGPGIALKGEALGLAVMTELPLVVINNQRGGPSTGLPTKTEQSDLLQALYGRHGEAPVCVLAISSPDSSFSLAYEACRIAIKYMTPVILLTEGYINNWSEPWAIPDPQDLLPFEVPLATALADASPFKPYSRNPETLARPWAKPGTPGLEHRIGGLEKENITGNISYDPENHHQMSILRAEKIQRIEQEIPPTKIYGATTGEVLVIGWGGTEGTLRQAVNELQQEGQSVSRIHLYHLNPLPPDLGTIIKNFKMILIPEINLGQLRSIIRDKFAVDAQGLNLVRGQPLKVETVKTVILKLLPSKVNLLNGKSQHA